MQTLGAFALKTHLSQVLREVDEKQETIAITRHGVVIALLTPPAKAENIIADTISAIQAHSKGITLGKNLSSKQLIEEGRR